MAFAQQDEGRDRPRQAQVAGHHRSAARPRRRGSGRTTASTTTSIRKAIQTEVIQLPATCLCRGGGQRHQLQPLCIMWHWKAADGAGRVARATSRSCRRLSSAPARALRQGRRRVPRSDRQHCTGPTRSRTIPIRPRSLKEINGYALEDLPGSGRSEQGAAGGRQAAAELRA
mgnify:CR=1 FL=1